LRIDAHHSFSDRYPLDYLGTILKRNRFEGSVLIAPQLIAVPPFVRGIVIECDLADPLLPHLLDEAQRHSIFKGVCHRFTDEIPAGLIELEHRGIPLDAVTTPGLIPRVMERFPSLRVVIDHLGTGDLAPDQWAYDLAQAAQSDRVFCKLSAVAGLPRVYVQHALNVFGPRRLMFGSDWPNGLPGTSWKASLAAFTQAIGAQTIEVREELLGGSAQRFYGLAESPGDTGMS